MARFILIGAAAILLFALSHVRADEPKLGEFAVPGERMAELIELAADGKLTTVPNELAAARQVSFLRNIIAARNKVSSGGNPEADPAVDCYRAVMAARAGDYHTAGILLENSLGTDHNDGDGHCLFLYQRWNGQTLTYRFLRWWAKHISGSNDYLGVVTLAAAAQLLALPLLLKLRRAIKTGRGGRELVWPALAAAFAELVPLCWAAASGPAWAFAYDIHGELSSGILISAQLACFIVFIICPGSGTAPLGERIGVGVIVFIFEGLLILGVLDLLQVSGLVSAVGVYVGGIFWSGTWAALLYYLVLLDPGSLRKSRRRTGV